jgi:Domain of unknown function (DUF4184)
MPFTFAHPAAVLPLRRFCQGRLVWSAVVIGTIAPDLEYFIRLTPRARLTASLPVGLVWDLVGGLLLFMLFHGLVKKPATLLLPARHLRAIWPIVVEKSRLTVGRGLAIGASLLVGAGTHRLWDSFTHRDGWAVQQIAALRGLLFELGRYQITTFKFLQHGSTLVGFVAIGLVYLHWLRRQPPTPSERAPVLRPGIQVGTIVAIFVSGLVVGTLNALAASSSPSGVRASIVHLGIGATTGGFLALIAVGVFFRFLGDQIIADQHG